MNITPSARILRMLGEIEFDEWQCVAELVDNSFDDFTEISRSGVAWPEGFKVSVTLPGSASRWSDAQIVITDTGRGMSPERLVRSVQAGWSSNDRFDKLGLFGMGFNVSTARLGKRTRVLTTRPGDLEWVGVEIDLDRLNDDFEADDITEPKSDPTVHGTRIEISRLHPDRVTRLAGKAAGLRTKLGNVYSWILDNQPFELYVQGQRVLPRRHCRWGDERYVTYGRGSSIEKIPAYMKIDETFESAEEACADCGNWQHLGKGKCDECDGERLIVRQRRIHGWLGVQRHLDKREFGIDFLRNGRKILQWDKQLFNWRDPNDPRGVVDVEYPIDLAHQGGRLIGEIHLDHVPVVYHKNAFVYTDRNWLAAVKFLRGTAPLQPDKAKRAGYPENISPLARLHKGYRRNVPGIRYLVPGDGISPIHDETRRWAQRFHAGDVDYQSDTRWWEAVVYHEKGGLKAGNAQPDTRIPPDEAAVLEALGVGTNGPSAGATSDLQLPVSGPSVKETAQERLARYLHDSDVVAGLSRGFGLRQLGHLQVETRRLRTVSLRDENDRPTPLLLVQGPGDTATAYFDPAHEVFTKFNVELAELLMVEVASVLKIRAESDFSHVQLVASLRAACLPDSALNVEIVSAHARELLADVRRRMAIQIMGNPGDAFKYLSEDELTATENEMIADGKVALTKRLGDTGDFLLYAPPLFMVKLLEALPEVFMDGQVFIGPYVSLSAPSARRLSLVRVVGYLTDIATVASFRANPGPIQLHRTRLSIKLLADELAEEV